MSLDLNNTSHAGYMIEDGHIPRDEDLVQDDKDSFVNLKRDLIALLDRAAKRCHIADVEDSYVAIEQSFDEMLHGAFEALNEEDGTDDSLPISGRYSLWLMEHRRPQVIFRPHASLGAL